MGEHTVIVAIIVIAAVTMSRSADPRWHSAELLDAVASGQCQDEPPAQSASTGQRFAPFLPEPQTNQSERLGHSLFYGQQPEQRELALMRPTVWLSR